MTTTHGIVHITTTTELTAHWRRLLRDEQFGHRSLWLTFLDAEQQVAPVIVPIDDIPEQPDQSLSSLRVIVEQLRDNGVQVVLCCLTRPGGSQVTASDRAWARGLASALDGLTGGWPIHLATAGGIRCLAPDDVV